jgi:hypothetical protein
MAAGYRACPARVVLAGRSLETTGLDNAGSLTSHNSVGLHGLLQEWLYFTY